MNIQVPFYNVLNVFLLGIIFICGISGILWESEPEIFRQIITLEIPKSWGYIIAILVIGFIYEIGYIVNRIGSLFIEPILQRNIPFKNYKGFNQLKEKNPILEVLSREYALCRGHIALWSILLIIYLLHKLIIIVLSQKFLCKWIVLPFAMIGIIVIFCLSMKKYAQKIQQLVNDEDIHETKK